MKNLGRRELLKTLATISGAAAVTTTASGRALKLVNEPAQCRANVLNVILHGMFAITADDQNITLVMPRVAGHYYAAGGFGLERPLRLNGAGPLSYTLSVPGWKPSRPVVSDRTDIVVHDKGGFHFDTEAFCNITLPATSEIFRPTIAKRGKRRIFAGSAGVASEPDAIPMVYVFQYTYAGGLPSLGDLWSADPAGVGAHNLHLWAAPPFFADHDHTQEGLDASALDELGDVYVVAPDREQSAVGHALTLHRPLRVTTIGERRFSVNGTPSDCVNLAVLGLLPERPILVAAGINHGSNLGDDVTYSGTVSAAMEGTLLGVPSMAVSQSDPETGTLEGAQAVAKLVASRVLVEGLPAKTLLNINVPAGPLAGIRVTRLGHRVYQEKVVRETDPRGLPYYWIGAGPPVWSEDEASDIAAVHRGMASVTPLHLDLTHHGALQRMAEWDGALSALLKKRLR